MDRHSSIPKLESRAFRLNIFGTLVMALAGLGVAVFTKSEAILLDGFFSLIAFVIALLTQKVGRLAMRPSDARYPFGYAAFEPMLNLFKGLLIGSICLFEMWSAISALFTGGRPISATGAIVFYAGAAAVGCFWLAWRIGILARRTRSPLIAVDAQSWIIDGLISATIMVVFLIIQFTKGTSIETLSPYADPVIVIVLVVSTISIPINIVRQAWQQIVGYCPDTSKIVAVETTINEAIKESTDDTDAIAHQVRTLEVGRFLYVEVHVVDLNGEYESLTKQDQLRDQLYSRLAQKFTSHIYIAVIFTQQQKWLNQPLLNQ